MCRIDLIKCCDSLPCWMFSNVSNFSFSRAPRIYVFESTFPVWLRSALRCLPALEGIDAVSMTVKPIIDGFAVGSTFTGTPLPFS